MHGRLSKRIVYLHELFRKIEHRLGTRVTGSITDEGSSIPGLSPVNETPPVNRPLILARVTTKFEWS